MTATDYETPATGGGWPRARLLLTGGTLAVTLALSACGGSAKPSKKAAQAGGGSSSSSSTSASGLASASGGGNTTKPGGDFCSLITADEAAAVLGVPIQPGLSRKGTGPAGLAGSCLYKAAKPDPAAPTVFNVIVLGTKIPRSVYESELKHDPQGGPTTAVPGLGEDAFYVPGIVTVFDHGLVLTLEVIKGGHAADTAVVIQLVRKALGRAGGLS